MNFWKIRSELTHPPPQGNRACRSKLTSQNLRLSDIEANSCARDEFEIKFHQSRHKSPIITNSENFAWIVFCELTFSGSKRKSNFANLAKTCKICEILFPRNFLPLCYIFSHSLTYWFLWSPNTLLYSANKQGIQIVEGGGSNCENLIRQHNKFFVSRPPKIEKGMRACDFIFIFCLFYTPVYFYPSFIKFSQC